jgi:hypothetical protein
MIFICPAPHLGQHRMSMSNSLLGVGLRVHRDVLAGAGGGDADHETAGRHDAVVGTQHGRAQPSDAVGAVAFGVAARGDHRCPSSAYRSRADSSGAAAVACRRRRGRFVRQRTEIRATSA